LNAGKEKIRLKISENRPITKSNYGNSTANAGAVGPEK
jgi:hypothetical protein